MDTEGLTRKLEEASTSLAEAFEITGGWEHDLTPSEKRLVSNIQSARSHVSRALMGLERA